METTRSSVVAVPFSACYGCGACEVACPKNAISTLVDERGFLRPVVDCEACTECGTCLAVCPVLQKPSTTSLVGREVYATWAQLSQLRLLGSSGGTALSLGLAALENGFDVLGASYSHDFRRVNHVAASDAQVLLTTIGSKYVQSYLAGALRQSFTRSNTRRQMVFGTPCQIQGVRNLASVKRLQGDLLLVDFFCHGVASYLLWWAFLDEMRNRVGEVKHAECRLKVEDWHRYRMRVVGERGVYVQAFGQTLFGRFYLSNYALRETCYSCPYRTMSAADVRLGDFWGKEFSLDPLGVSVTIPLTQRGSDITEANPLLQFRSVPSNWLSYFDVPKPSQADKVLNSLKMGESLRRTYGKYLQSTYLTRSVMAAPYRLLRAVVPQQVRNLLKTTLSSL